MPARTVDAVTIAGWSVLAVAATATFAGFRRARRAAAAQALAAASGAASFAGVVTAALASAHLVAVLSVELRRSPLVYDFRVYALLLLGATLVALGARLAAASAGVRRREPGAWKRAAWTAGALLAMTVPLAPIQRLAIPLSIFAAIGLAALVAVGPEADRG